MPIAGRGWELHIVREAEQRAGDGRRRTVGRYRVYHDGVAQTGPALSGATAEAPGPGANRPEGNGRRIAPGRYPLATWGGLRYVTWAYAASDDPEAVPQPGFELRGTDQRTEILVHPGQGFLRSVGCINPCAALRDAEATIAYAASRRRVVALIEDMRRRLGADFPTANGLVIPRAFAVVDGEP